MQVYEGSQPSTSTVVDWWLTHWGRVTHICVGKLTTTGSDYGLSPGRRQTIIWTNAGILLIGPLGTNFSEILIGVQAFSFKKMELKMSSAIWRPFCPGLDELTVVCRAAGQWQWLHREDSSVNIYTRSKAILQKNYHQFVNEGLKKLER